MNEREGRHTGDEADVQDNDRIGPGITPLLPEADLEEAGRRWHDIQSAFVDDPRRAVADADALVGVLIQQIATLFDDERTRFEALWERGDQVSTEELRLVLQRYRSFFERLLVT